MFDKGKKELQVNLNEIRMQKGYIPTSMGV